jgi:hypothetical protein
MVLNKKYINIQSVIIMGLTQNSSRDKYRLVVVMCLTDNLAKRKVVQTSHVPKYRVIGAKMQKYA